MPLNVVAAVFARNNRYLCLRRSMGRSLAGYWEFPGGKVEADESLHQALIREIKEELCVDIEVDDYLGDHLHQVGCKTGGTANQIKLHVFVVTNWSGQIELVDHDQLYWGSADEIRDLNWSPADIPFVEMLALRDNK